MLTINAFDTFHRPSFQMKKLKDTLTPEEMAQLMAEHKAAFTKWETLLKQVADHVADLKIILEGNDGYQNGYAIRSRFWFRFKLQDRLDSGSCIAVLVDKDGIEVYLEWHETLKGKQDTVAEHNQVIHRLEAWAENVKVDPSTVHVQTDQRQDGPRASLEIYLKDDDIRSAFRAHLSSHPFGWIIVGKRMTKEAAIASERLALDIVDWIRLFHGLYEEPECKYWLFNVYYSKDPSVWEQCKKWEVAAMQYELGREDSSAVTRNLNQAKQLGLGDRIIAYTGNQGFLAIGTVTRTFFEESESEKFFHDTSAGGHWRQRVGVDWFVEAPEPVKLSGRFKETLQIDRPMGSQVIFELGAQAYQEIRHLFTKDEGDLVVTNTSDSFAKYVRDRGFNYDESILRRYELSLRSKPFVILSGISGTGKTKIAQLFAEYMSEDDLADIEEPIHDEFSTIYTVKPYNLKYKRMIIPKMYEPLLTLPSPGESIEIKVVLEEIEDQGRLYMDVNGKYSSLLFKGAFSKGFTDRFLEGDRLRITFDRQDDGDVIRFSKVDESVVHKQVRVPRHAFISVRPDWIDHRSLLGYYNPLTEQYQLTAFLKLMLRAAGDMEKRPYFVILDEMNLAKVEHYFSDFLSCLESRRIGEDGRLVSEPIQLHDVSPLTIAGEDGFTYVVPPRIEIPENLYFTGTVNVDETTYMFSPKVLDRANVIEFNDVNLEHYRQMLGQTFDHPEEVNRANSEQMLAFTNRGQYHADLIGKSFSSSAMMQQAYDWICDLHSLLTPYQMHFGYRVVDEMLMFLTQAEATGYFSMQEALDYQIVQRILPKYHGNRKKLQHVLQILLHYCNGWSIEDIHGGLPRKVDGVEPEIRFHESSAKLERMLQKLADTGFVSFIE